MAVSIDVPIGGVITWVGRSDALSLPPHFRLCNGDALDVTTYQQLYNLIGGIWGPVKNGHFYLPDFRGYFLRGVDNNMGRDPDSANRTPLGSGGPADIGSYQPDQFQAHQHQTDMNSRNDWPGCGDGGSKAVTNEDYTNNPRSTQGPISGNYGAETRPKNVYVQWLIRVD